MLELQTRILFVELAGGHLVVVGFVVAQLRSALRGFGQTCLHGQHIADALCAVRICGHLASCEHVCHVLLVGLADGHGGGVSVEIVIFLSHVQTALAHLQQVVFAVLDVGIDVVAEHAADALHLQ